jgi:hypothetical protein
MSRYLNILLSAACVVLWFVETPERLDPVGYELPHGQIQAVVPVAVLVDSSSVQADSSRWPLYRVCGYLPVSVVGCDPLIEYVPDKSIDKVDTSRSGSGESPKSTPAQFALPLPPRIRLPRIGDILTLPL